ncbi:MAG: glycosyl hydrolase [Parvibaculaceae bacterium]
MTASEDLAGLSAVLDLMADKVREDEARLGVVFPYVTGPDGQWRTMPASHSAGYAGAAWSHGNWFCGFWVGLLAASHLHKGDADLLLWAKERMRLIAERAKDPNTHDIGFIFWSSAVRLHQLTGEPHYAALAVEAADRLRARLVATTAGAYISAWGPHSDERGRSSSAIDTMANIPLLYWAARTARDDSFLLAGEAHAQSTARTFIRADSTLYHAVQYDLKSGTQKRGYTFQGYGDESSWSRGTGWAVYGYAASAAATGKRAYLDLAVKLAEKWLDQLKGAQCPPWDFDDPSPTPGKDSSAAAIMAAALLDVAALHPEPGERTRWRTQAKTLLSGLIRSCLATDGRHRGLLRHGCYSMPHKDGTDSAVMFGDYYFVEAIMRLVHPGKFAPEFAPLAG